MAFTLSSIAAKDGAAATIGGGLLAADIAGGGVGPWIQFGGIVDGLAGVNRAQITAANALKVDNSGVTQPISGSVSVTGSVTTTLASTTITGTVAVTESGTWTVRNTGNAGAIFDAATAAAVPANALYVGMNSTGNLVGLVGDTTNGLWVNIKAGAGSGGTALADKATFTDGTTSITPTGGVFNTAHTAPTSGQAAAFAINAAREQLTINKVWDGTNTATVKAASTLPVATDQALVVTIRDVNANVQSGAPVTVVAQTPTATANGLTPSRVVAAGSTNATSVKASAGQLYEIDVFNTAAYSVFLKLYNKASAPTVGTDTPVWTIPVQAGGGYSRSFQMGRSFSTGIAYAITKLQADSDTTVVVAGDLTGSIGWI